MFRCGYNETIMWLWDILKRLRLRSPLYLKLTITEPNNYWVGVDPATGEDHTAVVIIEHSPEPEIPDIVAVLENPDIPPEPEAPKERARGHPGIIVFGQADMSRYAPRVPQTKRSLPPRNTQGQFRGRR